MASIAGVIRFDGAPVEPRLIERMAGALPARGTARPRLVADGCAAFAAWHPLGDGAGGRLVFAGRLDNRDEIRTGISLPPPASAGDPALAAAMWQRFGLASLARFAGDFALAHWDAPARRLTLATSAPRGRPLYVHRKGAFLAFATTPQALFALPQVPRALDDAALADLLVGNGGSGASLFAGIETVPFAHRIEHDPSGETRARYWRPEQLDGPSPFATEAAAWEAANALLEVVVRDQLGTGDGVGVLLSGGLDSAIVAGQAARLLAPAGARLRSYTRVPLPGTPLRDDALAYDDERPRVAALARLHANLDPCFVDAGDEPVLQPRIGGPGQTQGMVPAPLTYTSGYAPLYRRAAAEGRDTLLVGTGGDLTLSWNGHSRLRALFRQGRWMTLAHELRRYRAVHGHWRAFARDALLIPVTPPPLRDAVAKLRGTAPDADLRTAATPGFAIETGAVDRIAERNLEARWTRANLHDLRLDMLSPMLSGFTDHILATYGIERRAPLADRRIAEFCLALPDRFCLADGIDRRLARLGFAHLIPPEIAQGLARGRQDSDWAVRLQRDAARIDAAIETLAVDSDVAHRIDIAAMRRTLAEFRARDWRRYTLREAADIQRGLMRGIEIGQFIRWFHGRN